MQNLVTRLEHILEAIDSYRDKILFSVIKPFWPRRISPNHLTSIRIVIGIILFTLLFFFRIEHKTLIITLFGLGMITDFIDGPVARGTDRVTEFGAMLDSTADRIIIVPIAMYVLFNHHPWLLLTLIIMEILNALVSLYYKSKEIYLESNIFGKIKIFLLAIVFIVILYIWPQAPSPFFIGILWLSILFTILSGVTRILEITSRRNTEHL